MKTKNILYLSNIILLIMAVIWAVLDSSMEPKIAVGSFVVTILVLYSKYNNEESTISPTKMKQKAGKGSKQYQAGRDIKIRKK